jgi:hypothetical protein
VRKLLRDVTVMHAAPPGSNKMALVSDQRGDRIKARRRGSTGVKRCDDMRMCVSNDCICNAVLRCISLLLFELDWSLGKFEDAVLYYLIRQIDHKHKMLMQRWRYSSEWVADIVFSASDARAGLGRWKE